MILELLLASHQGDCQTCPKGADCKLLALATRLGVKDVRFKKSGRNLPLDLSSPSIARDPNKCILCGDCVRMCSEIQGVGAIGFAGRGANSVVTPCFGREIATVECVDCGQCTKVCPTGALTIHSDTDDVLRAIQTEGKYVVAAIAPAVRVAIGEEFGLESGANAVGKLVATLKMMGFDAVYDVSYTADLTIVEEANEFLNRVGKQRTPADVHLLLPRVGEVHGAVLQRFRGKPVHLPLPAADAGLARQGNAARRIEHRPPGHRVRIHHALHGQEVRSQARGVQNRGRAGRRLRDHHARAFPPD